MKFHAWNFKTSHGTGRCDAPHSAAVGPEVSDVFPVVATAEISGRAAGWSEPLGISSPRRAFCFREVSGGLVTQAAQRLLLAQ